MNNQINSFFNVKCKKELLFFTMTEYCLRCWGELTHPDIS